MYNAKIIETLESLEDRIESIKWLVTTPFHLKRTEVSEVVKTIRKSAGILGRTSLEGIPFENKVRKDWENNFLKRTT